MTGASGRRSREERRFLVTDTPGGLRGTVVAACRAAFSVLSGEVEFRKIDAQVEN